LTLSLSRAGEGTNSVGNSSAQFRLSVLFPPEIRLRESVVHGLVDNLNVNSIDLACEVHSEPASQTYWTKDGRQIFPSKSREVLIFQRFNHFLSLVAQKYVFRRINGTTSLLSESQDEEKTTFN
jgi:hypothetical protein